MSISVPLFRPRVAASLLCLLAASATSVLGQSSPPTLDWGASGAGGSGTWSTSTSNADWYNGTSNTYWTNNDAAVFAGTAGTVSISGDVDAAQATFSTAGYTVTGGFLSGTSSGLTVETDANATISSAVFGTAGVTTPFTKTGSGVLTFTGEGPVFFTSVNINAGQVSFTGTGTPDFSTPYVLANSAGVGLALGTSVSEIGSLAGSNSATFAGTIQDNGSASLAFTKYGNSTQTLTGANTYSGVTSVIGSTFISGGTTSLLSSTLALGGASGSALNTASVTVANGGILQLDNSTTSNNQRLSSGVPVTLNGGTLSLLGNPTTSTTQTVGALGFSEASTITVTQAGNSTTGLVLSSVSRQNNGTISFSGGGYINAATLTNTNGIVGAYATVNGTDWATVDGSGNISAYTGYTSDPTASNAQSNLRLATANGATTTLTSASTVFNSVNLVNTGSASAVLDLGSGHALALTSGGLLTSGSGGQIILNGTLSASGGELLVTNQNALTISSAIADGAMSNALTKSGAGTLLLTGPNTYTGTTTIDQGIVQVATDGNLGAGSAVALSGGTLQASAAFTSAKSLQGTGGTLDTGAFSVAFNGGNNTGAVTKVGTGVLSLTGTVSSLNVVAGTAHLSNLTAGNTAAINLYGGRLEASGTGVSSVLVSGSAEISPGSIGQAASFTIGGLGLNGSTAVIDFDLGSQATDSLTLSSTPYIPILSSISYRFNNLGGVTTGVSYTLLNLPSGDFGLSTTDFAIDPMSTAAGYKGNFNLTYNTLTIVFTAVPEPSTWALLCVGVGGMLGVALRRRRPRAS